MPIPAAVPIVLGAASLAGGLFGKRPKAPKPQQIDITQELAMIGEMYKQARQQQEVASQRGLAQGLRQTSESLAGRGIYRSPVSEQAIGQTRKTYATALADALAELSAQEAGKKAELSAAAKQWNAGQMAEYNANRYKQQQVNQAMLTSGLTGMGANLLYTGVPSLVSSFRKEGSVDGTVGSGIKVKASSPLDTDFTNYMAQVLYGLKGGF